MEPDLTPDAIEEGLDRLETIQEELEEIKQRTANPRRSFYNGIFQGVGVLLGGIFGAIALGWILSILGVVPGFGDLADYLRTFVDNFERTH